VKLRQIAQALGLELEGDPELELRGVGGLEDAVGGELSFATGPRYRAAFAASRASAFLLPPDFESLGRPCLRSLAPYADFARAIDLLLPPLAHPEPAVHPSAVVAADAVLGADVSVGPFAVIGAGSRIGDRSVIHPHVTLYAGCEIGADCVIHAGAQLREGTRLGDRVVVQNGVVLGSDGFGFAHRADGSRFRVPHRSPVEIADDAEIGANSTIDASHPGQRRFGHEVTRTRVGRGVKIDNLVQVGHGCALGEGSTICAQVGLAGSTELGRHVLFAGQSASAGHVRIGDGALIGGRAGVASDVEPGAQLLGAPAMERRAWGRFIASRKRIPELFRRVRALEQRLGLRREQSDDG
jgi:UDP-3-O-[3-hydroxymyristoyl] glucosamine N-acyltransferase